MKKWLKRAAMVILLAFVAMQFTNPSLKNPPVLPGHDLLASNPPPTAIASALTRCCYDCHSFATKWPWYSHIAPVSWLVVRDVDAARAALNFSDWPHDNPARARKRWRHIADEIENGEMPLSNYTLIHRESQLGSDERRQLIQFARLKSQ